jgi:hypothetical protein
MYEDLLPKMEAHGANCRTPVAYSLNASGAFLYMIHEWEETSILLRIRRT